MPGVARKTQPTGERAERILAAADKLFCKNGYSGVSMSQLAAEADVNKALIFYYYGSKDGLFEKVLKGYYRAHAEAVTDALAEGGTFRERIHHLLENYFDFLEHNQRYTRMIQHEILRTGDHLKIIRKSLAALFSNVEPGLAEMVPAEGPLSRKQFFLTLSGMMVVYYTNAPVLGGYWGTSPMSAAARAERREHCHWVLDAILDRLEAERR